MREATARLIVFTRYPEPGRVKTRLIPALGARAAAALHSQLAGRTIATAQQLCQHERVALEIHHTDSHGGRIQRWLAIQPMDRATQGAAIAGILPSGCLVRLRPQMGATLGLRMHHALAQAHQDGCPQAILIGTDVPGLTNAHLGEAFAALARHDLVLGPAKDGGYYLIGLRTPCADLFGEVPWGTHRVLETTLELARRAELEAHLLPSLADIDRPEDLPLLADYAELVGFGASARGQTKDAP